MGVFAALALVEALPPACGTDAKSTSSASLSDEAPPWEELRRFGGMAAVFASSPNTPWVGKWLRMLLFNVNDLSQNVQSKGGPPA